MLSVNNLKESNDFLRLLLDNINSAVFLIDENLRVKSFNNSFKTIFGKDEEAFNQLCGNALGCVFAVKENTDCGLSSNCDRCYLRTNVLAALIEDTPKTKEKLEREWNERFASTLAHIFEPWRTRKIEAR